MVVFITEIEVVVVLFMFMQQYIEIRKNVLIRGWRDSMFSAIFGWFSGFFKRVAKTFIGKAAEEMSEAALVVVEALEEKNLTGEEKYRKAKKTLKDKYPSAEGVAINLAIETALAIVKDKLK